MPSTYTPIASTTLGSAAASYTFSNIPGSFTDLVVCVHASVSSTVAGGGVTMRFNNDSGSNYSYTRLASDGNSVISFRRTNYTEFAELVNGTPGLPRAIVLNVMSYTNTNVFKNIIGDGISNALTNVHKQVGLWRSTAAITSISFIPALSYNFESGSTFSLYGIKAA